MSLYGTEAELDAAYAEALVYAQGNAVSSIEVEDSERLVPMRVAARMIMYSTAGSPDSHPVPRVLLELSQRAGGLVLPGGGLEEQDTNGRGLVRALFGSPGALLREMREEIGLRGWARTVVTSHIDWFPVGCCLWWLPGTDGGYAPRFDAVVSADVTRVEGSLDLGSPIRLDPDILGFTWLPLKLFHPRKHGIAVHGGRFRILPNTAAELALFRSIQKGNRLPGFGLIEVGEGTGQ